MAERLIRTSEAATLLGVSTRSIYRMARAGVLRRVRVRYGGPRYRLSEVRALMEARRVRNRGGVEDLKHGGFRARIRGRCLDGRNYDLARTRATREEAERALEGLRKRALDLEAGTVVLEDTTTLADWRKRATRLGLTWDGRDTSTFRYLRPLWNRPMLELDAASVEVWARRLKESKQPSTVRSAWILLSRLVHFAVRKKLLGALPWGTERLRLVSESECRQRDGLEPDEWARLREAARALDARGRGGPLSDLWLRLCVMAMTGLRPIELCRLTWGDIVPTEHGPALHNRQPAKGGKGGLKPIDPALADALSAHRGAMPDAARRTGWLFPRKGQRGRWLPRWRMHRDGRQVGQHWVMEAEVKELRAEAVLPEFVPYQLRHTRLTELAHTFGQQAAQNAGGHTTPRMLGRYVHPKARHLDEGQFDGAALLGLGPDGEPPDGPGPNGGRRVGRFRVHDGGAPASAPKAATEQASAPKPAPKPATEHRGRALGAEPPDGGGELPDIEDVERYVRAVELFGAPDVARGIVKADGPIEALKDAEALKRFIMSARCPEEWTAQLVSLNARLRAQACKPPVSTTDQVEADLGDIF
ncbi:MAG: hypothetical protein SangKO_031800 [Sandaracinaceae bacterium]